MAAAPPPTSIFWPVSVSLPSSFLNTWMFFWIMFCAATVLPSLEKDTPCDQAPIGASLTLVSLSPSSRYITSMPLGLNCGASLGRVEPPWATPATHLPSFDIMAPSRFSWPMSTVPAILG